MAQRPVFVANNKKISPDIYRMDFAWNGGFAVSQKQKNITALHNAFKNRFPEKEVLEISSKSMQELGVKLSAFNLKKYVPELKNSVPLECVFQGGKVFEEGGAYTDLYSVSARDAKKDPRLKSSGTLQSFYFDGKQMPLVPKTAFYNWLYIGALIENSELAEQILKYDSFTDIEFNPDKSINCQAEAAAIFVSLARKGLVERWMEFDTFVKYMK